MTEFIEGWKIIITTSLEQLISILVAYLPSIAGAVALMLLGLLIAASCRWIVLRLGQGTDQLVRKAGFRSILFQYNWAPSRIIAATIYWLIIIFFLTIAAKILELPGIDGWIDELVTFIPDIVVAVAIIWGGAGLGGYVRDKTAITLSKYQVQYSQAISKSSRVIIIVMATIVALGQVGVNVQFIEQVLIVTISAFVLALSLSFGLGAGAIVTNMIAVNQLKKIYAKGQRINIDGLEGQILEFTKSAVLINTVTGQAMIPVKIFQEKSSILHDEVPQ